MSVRDSFSALGNSGVNKTIKNNQPAAVAIHIGSRMLLSHIITAKQLPEGCLRILFGRRISRRSRRVSRRQVIFLP